LARNSRNANYFRGKGIQELLQEKGRKHYIPFLIGGDKSTQSKDIAKAKDKIGKKLNKLANGNFKFEIADYI